MTQSRIEQLEELIKLDPDDHTLHYMIGLEHLESGRVDDAVLSLERYLEVEEANQGDAGACLGRLAEAYRQAGRTEDAVQAYRRGIRSAVQHNHADLRNELTAAMQAIQEDTDQSGP
jgi:cytochrome c-type biogenesis protein CcmH/NrfG